MEFPIHRSARARWFTCPLLEEGGGPVHAFGARTTADSAPAPAGVLLEELGRPDAALLPVRQVHGSRVLRADGAGESPDEADGVVTDSRGLAPVVTTADCIPLLLWDPNARAVGAVHAGRQGLSAGVVEQGVLRLREEYGSRPERLLAAVGPSIGPCCYEVGEEVARTFGDRSLRPGFGERPCLDLWEVARDRLTACGLAAGRIAVARLCTSCNPGWFVSYRRDGEGAGRLPSLILLPES